jgi:5'-nucleotidase (lipoprotein e(P4) family)
MLACHPHTGVTMRRAALAPALLLVLACGTGRTGVPVGAATPAPALPDEVHWVRNSAEHDALFHQTFFLAGEELKRRAAAARPGSWATVIDADEAAIDNSEFERDLALSPSDYDEESWNEWVRQRKATALPGAVRYARLARALGGRVIVVTNRAEVVCDATRENLAAAGIVADLVLCKPEGESDKNPRFAQIAAGTASPDLPPLEVLVWVGDNIRDFPLMSQELRFAPDSAFGEFGRQFFILPNPMYGSWEDNPAE